MSIQGQINRITQNVSDTYSTLNDLGATMPAEATSDNLPQTAGSVTAVLYGKAQSLTDEQKAQARENIGVGEGGANEIVSMTAEEYEALTTEEKAALYTDGVRVIAVDDGADMDSLTEQQKFANFVYPVGMIVELVVDTNPASLWGIGTWESYLPGRVLVGAGTADSGTVYTAGDVGGEETHTLIEDELPNITGKMTMHSTELDSKGSQWWDPKGVFSKSLLHSTYVAPSNGTTGATSVSDIVFDAGGDQPHNNMQPYGVVYRWLRTA